MERSLDRVLPGLVTADPLRLRDAGQTLHRAEHVEYLSDVEFDPEFVPDPPGGRIGARHQLVGVDECQVADQDRHALAESACLTGPAVGGVTGGEHGMAGRFAASAVGVVHHVVVEQGERVHQLERRSGVDDDGVVGVAADSDERPMAERRTQALAPRQHEPPDLGHRIGQVGIELGPAGQLGDEECVDPSGHPIGDQAQTGGGNGRHREQATPSAA